MSDRRLGLTMVGLAGRVALGSLLVVGVGSADDDTGSRIPSSTRSMSQVEGTGRRVLEVSVRLRSQDGRVFCALWSEPEGFPVEGEAASHEDMTDELHDRRAKLRFTSVDAGQYALACFHDENGNGRLDTNFVGIPSEGTGASNDAHGFMGPPSYDDARFEVTEAGPLSLTVEIDY